MPRVKRPIDITRSLDVIEQYQYLLQKKNKKPSIQTFATHFGTTKPNAIDWIHKHGFGFMIDGKVSVTETKEHINLLLGRQTTPGQTANKQPILKEEVRREAELMVTIMDEAYLKPGIKDYLQEKTKHHFYTDEEKIIKLLKAIRLGMSKKASSEYAGITEQQLYNWLKMPEFKNVYSQAQRAFHMDMQVALTKKAHKGDIAAIKTLLESNEATKEDYKPKVEDDKSITINIAMDRLTGTNVGGFTIQDVTEVKVIEHEPYVIQDMTQELDQKPG